MATETGWLREHIRDIPDFPEPGVSFKDITPLLADVDGFRFAVDALADHFVGQSIDCVLGIEARGFILGAPVAYRFGAAFVPVRKPGKLPWETVSQAYELEYGTDAVELHTDAVGPGHRALIIDDVLATGGTAAATAALVESVGGEVAGFGFLIELAFLGGRSRINGYELASLLVYDRPR